MSTYIVKQGLKASKYGSSYQYFWRKLPHD